MLLPLIVGGVVVALFVMGDKGDKADNGTGTGPSASPNPNEKITGTSPPSEGSISATPVQPSEVAPLPAPDPVTAQTTRPKPGVGSTVTEAPPPQAPGDATVIGPCGEVTHYGDQSSVVIDWEGRILPRITGFSESPVVQEARLDDARSWGGLGGLLF